MTTTGIARRSLLGAAAAAGAAAPHCAARAQAAAPAYPSRPIALVVPYGPGSSTDNVARPVAQGLQQVLGQPVVIDNRAGASGLIGTQFAARARPDGYTLLVGSSTTLAANLGLFRTLPYDPVRDFVPVAGMARTSMIVLVRPDFAGRDMQGLLAMARAAAAPLPVAHGSASAQVGLAQLSQVSGVTFTPVPYRDTPQLLAGLMGGQVAVGLVDVGNAVPYLRDGRLIGLATSAPTRTAFTPEVPALAELWPDTQLVTLLGLVAPAGTPPAIVARLEQAVATVMARPEIRQAFATMGTEIDATSQAELARRLERDRTLWVALVRLAGIEPQ
jgi:tripartite-type tricarboxylate transporter receptor subunit TctC